MADNIDVKEASGVGTRTVACDDVSGLLYQVIKLAVGGDGAADYISNSNPVPISDAGGAITVDGTVSVSGAVDTELPAAGSLGDATSNPSTTSVGALALLFNGTTWDRMRGDTTNGLDVDVTRLPALPAGTNNIGDVDVLTLPALPTGTNTIGSVKITDGTLTASVRDTGSSDSLNVAIVDGSGNQVTSFGGGVQYTEADTDSTITGTAMMWEDTSDTLRAVSAAKPLPVAVQNSTIAVTQSGTWVSGANNGVDIGDVTINNASGGSAVNIQDGGNSITVDSPAATPLHVGITNTADTLVKPGDATNNAIRANVVVALPAGTNNIGDVDVLTLPALPSGSNTIGSVKLTDGTDVADVLDLTNSNPLTVAIVDGTGDQITSFGGGTQYTEGDTDASITGTAMLWEDGSDTLRAVSSGKPLPVNVVSGSAAGTEYTEDAAAPANPAGPMTMARRADTPAATTTTDGDVIAVNATDKGELYIKHVDTIPVTQSGTWNVTNISGTVSLPTGASTAAKQPALGTAGSASSDVITVQGIASMTALKVDGSAVTQPVSGTVTANAGTGSFTVAQATASNLNCTEASAAAIKTSVELIDDAIVADDAAFTPATTKVLMSGFTFDDVAPDSVNEGDAGAGRMSANRCQYMTIRDAAGNERGVNVSAGNALIVDGSASTQPVSGTVTANAGTGNFTVIQGTAASLNCTEASAAAIKTSVELIDDCVVADDAAFTPATTKVLMAGFEFDDSTPDSVNEGDAGAARMSANRNIYTTLRDAAGNERGVNVTAGNALTVDASATNQPVVGNVAHDASDSGNPVKIGGKARTTNPTAVADADRADLFMDDVGRPVVLLNQCRDLTAVQQTTITASTAETTVVTAAGSGVFADLLSLTITNSSATALIVTLKDSTAGTTRAIYALAANGGITIPFPTPLAQATANNNWTLTCGSSVSSIYVVAQYAKNV